MLHEVLCIRKLDKDGLYKKLRNVSFVLCKGEILALVGNHDAGIPELISILLGKESFDSGIIYFCEKQISPSMLLNARQLGICRIGKENLLIPNLTVAENICMSRYYCPRGVLTNPSKMNETAQKLLKAYGISIDVRKKAGDLADWEKKLVEIIKTVTLNTSLLILDNVLTNFVDRCRIVLINVLSKLKANGIAIIITEYDAKGGIEIADKLCVMNDGSVVGTFMPHEYDLNTINALMTSHLSFSAPISSNPCAQKEVLRISSLVVDNISFPDMVFYAGEIAEIDDNGFQYMKLLIDVLRGKVRYSGSIWINGREVSLRTQPESKACGIAYLTNYLSSEILLDNMSIIDNLMLVRPKIYSAYGLIKRRIQHFASCEYARKEHLPERIDDLLPSDLNSYQRNRLQMIKIQSTRPSVLILDSPFLYADKAMKQQIFEFVIQMRESGVCIIANSIDKDEYRAILTRYILLNPT